jgi:glycosyltransferase involved in cell wall biosynthesis
MMPLLSICVPTYNRAERLRVMLQALLPQVAEQPDKIEVWISDNASNDKTVQIVEEARTLAPLYYSRNESNLGVIKNIIKLTNQLAQGEYVWLLGDDDLLLPGALARVLAQIEQHRELDAIYFNFRCSDYPDDWPEQALGGYRGAFKSLANRKVTDEPIDQWHELIDPESSMCTQLYAHVVRRKLWVDYWRGRKLADTNSTLHMTYPHTCMIASYMMRKPTFYVGEPVLNIFDGGQSWNDLQSIIVLLRIPQLLRFYKDLGLPPEKLRQCEQAVFSNCDPLLMKLLNRNVDSDYPSLASYVRTNWRSREAWRALIRAVRASDKPPLVYKLLSLAASLRA